MERFFIVAFILLIAAGVFSPEDRCLSSGVEKKTEEAILESIYLLDKAINDRYTDIDTSIREIEEYLKKLELASGALSSLSHSGFTDIDSKYLLAGRKNELTKKRSFLLCYRHHLLKNREQLAQVDKSVRKLFSGTKQRRELWEKY